MNLTCPHCQSTHTKQASKIEHAGKFYCHGCKQYFTRTQSESLGAHAKPLEKQIEPPKFSYSIDEESYTGEFSTREEAAAEAFHENPEASVVYVGENVKPDPTDFISAEQILEHIQEQDEFSGEWAENWPNVSGADIAELTEALAAIFKAWLDKHNAWPRFWNVINDRRVENPNPIDIDPNENPDGSRPAGVFGHPEAEVTGMEQPGQESRGLAQEIEGGYPKTGGVNLFGNEPGSVHITEVATPIQQANIELVSVNEGQAEPKQVLIDEVGTQEGDSMNEDWLAIEADAKFGSLQATDKILESALGSDPEVKDAQEPAKPHKPEKARKAKKLGEP